MKLHYYNIFTICLLVNNMIRCVSLKSRCIFNRRGHSNNVMLINLLKEKIMINQYPIINTFSMFHSQWSSSTSQDKESEPNYAGILSNQKVLPKSLQIYMRKLIRDVIIKVTDNKNIKLKASLDLMEDSIYFQLMNKTVYSVNYSSLVQTCLTLVKSIELYPHYLSHSLISIDCLLNAYDQNLKTNRNMFKTITSHHYDMVDKEWGIIISDKSSLTEYSKAASLMGEKRWVIESNKWLENFSLSFFRFNSAKKHYIKMLKSKIDKKSDLLKNQNFIDQIEQQIANSWSLPKDLMKIGSNQISNIRILDVGSCYNPLAKSENASSFDITAIDLLPADSSVYKCDFLHLQVLKEGSAPLFDDQNSLVGLAAKSFDVVVLLSVYVFQFILSLLFIRQCLLCSLTYLLLHNGKI